MGEGEPYSECLVCGWTKRRHAMGSHFAAEAGRSFIHIVTVQDVLAVVNQLTGMYHTKA